jgi:hypothetical protein
MRVDLLLVLGLDDENDLNGNEIFLIILAGQDELWGRIDGELRRVLRKS